MLKLKQITKDYVSGDLTVHALKGVNLSFRKSEFVAILGQSGCGKTTMLNIMGGLDKYTSGDLEINGVSTVKYKDADWDNYRNHSVGFVFQSYNLIMHQSVLANVELALTLSGVKKEERRARATEALKRVGLEQEIHKMPNQLSGGQMQRVAIARAIVNNPDIILADEPTGALDSSTSVQVMEILKQIATDRLVIMVTHNPELAEMYSTRIITMSDGLVVNDSNPVTEEELLALEQERENLKEQELLKQAESTGKPVKKEKQKKAKMSLWTAFSLSLKNLFTKKARTILTSIAGSIGIIGIALILAVSTGFQQYIDNVERATLSSEAITLQDTSLTSLTAMTSLMSASGEDRPTRPATQEIYSDNVTEQLVNKVSSVLTTTDLTGFKYYMKNNLQGDKIHGFRYSYTSNPIRLYGKNDFIKDYDPSFATTKKNSDYKLLYPYNTQRLNKSNFSLELYDIDVTKTLLTMFNSFSPFTTPLLKYDNSGNLVDNWDLIQEQYDLIATNTNYDLSSGLKENQVLIVVDSKNQIPDSALFSLGLRGEDKLIYSMLDAFVKVGKLDPVLDENLKNFFAVSWPNLEQINAMPEGTEQEKAQKQALLDAANQFINGMKEIGVSQSAYEQYQTKYNDLCSRKTNFETSSGVKGWQNYFYNSQNGQTDKDYIIKMVLKLFFGYNYVPEDVPENDITFKDIFDLNATKGYKIVATADEYYLDGGKVKQYNNDQVNANLLKDSTKQDRVVNLEIAGIIRLKESASFGTLSPGLVYSNKLLEKVISLNESNAFVQEVTNSTLTEQQFKDKYTSVIDTQNMIPQLKDAISKCDPDTKDGKKSLESLNDQLDAIQQRITLTNVQNAFSVLKYSKLKVGKNPDETDKFVTERYITSVSIYASSFDNKQYVVDFIKDYNKKIADSASSGVYGEEVQYSDLIGTLFESVDIILNAITYVLVAFVGISLVVSSIMIGIITYISVLERTKEIGVLRSIGASKGDVGRVFNAETIIIGLASGLLGVIISALITIPIRIFLKALTGVIIPVALPFGAAVMLIAISVFLTFIAGLIPSRIASKKDPVVALRTE